MLIEDLNLSSALAAARCPRCRTAGLKEIDWDTYRATPDQDKLQSRYLVCPSVYCRCPACGLASELHELLRDEPEGA